MDQFWKFSGIAIWILLCLWLLFRLIFGKQWLVKVGLQSLLGPGIVASAKKWAREAPEPSRETNAELAAQVFKRLTRVGLFAIFVALVPFILLYLQNNLIQKQNQLFELQNSKIERQTKLDSMQMKLLANQNILFLDQNVKVTEQTGFLKQQTGLFRDQNTKIDIQTDLFKEQNNRLNLQNNLLEADRRSSLVFLMSNILDKVDAEIKEQRDSLKKRNQKLPEEFGPRDEIPDSIKYVLSKPLISRIVALSLAFKPYRIMKGDKLAKESMSPERGQLFISLMKNNLSQSTQEEIAFGDFSKADIGAILLWKAWMPHSNFEGANLSYSELTGTHFSYANFSHANLSHADLIDADFSLALLTGAKLDSAYLISTKMMSVNLSKADLSKSFLGNAYLYGSNLSEVNLSKADLRDADLGATDLNKANMMGADLAWADFDEAENLTIEQLKQVKSLYQCENLDPKLKAQLEKERPCLFTKDGCPEND